MSSEPREWWVTKPQDIKPNNHLAVAWTDIQIREKCKGNEVLIEAFKAKRIHVMRVKK